jgi:hypothetical protein
MKNFILTVAAALLVLTACQPPEQEQAQQEQRQQQMQMQMVQSTAEFNSQMEQLLERYFDLKDALVESDAEAATEYAELLREYADGVDASSLNQETQALWVAYGEVITGSSSDLIGQADVDDQRYHFEYISEAMIEMTVTFQPVGYTVYHQSCPMVRDGSADWLSREEQISNPYHGDRMMRCGETIRRI